MKNINLIILLVFTCSSSLAQPVANPGMRELEEKVIPWDRILPPIGNALNSSTTVQGRKYSAYQIGLIDVFTDWIKKSYIPVGGLPQQERYALPDSRENKLYQPQGTGVAMGLWAPCYDPSGKKIIKAQPASRHYIVIATNHLKGLEPAFDFNTPTQYYFTMYYKPDGKLVKESDAIKDEPFVQEIRSMIGNYFVYFTGSIINVLLMPENELPVVQVTKGEVLDQSEAAIKRTYPDPNSPMQKEVLADIRKFREKHRNRLQEPAFVHMAQLTSTSFRGEQDPFEPLINDPEKMFPVYRFKPHLYELAKQDKPLWVHISFPYANEKSKTVNWEIFKAMTRNFNYQYVYDYFFSRDKIAGKSYQPRQAVTQSQAEATISKRENKASQSRTYPEGVHFMEDFSDAVSGTMPAGWSSRQNNRGFVIEAVPGENGKWLYIDSGADLFPSSLKKPLPANFTLEFDLLCTDYKNRTGRTVTLQLSGPAFTARLYITPGNEDNIRIYPSMAGFSINAGSSNGRHTIEFSSYSNKKKQAHVRIVRSGSSLVAYINGQKVESDPKYKQDYVKEMSIPANAECNKLEWTSDVVSTNPPEDKGKVYISNILIKKD